MRNGGRFAGQDQTLRHARAAAKTPNVIDACEPMTDPSHTAQNVRSAGVRRGR